MPELDASTAQQLFQTLDPDEQRQATHLMQRMRGRDAVAHILAQRQAYELGVTSHEAANLTKKPSAGQALASEALGVADSVSGGAAEGYGALADAPDGLQIPAALLAASPAGLPTAVTLSALGFGKTPKIPGVGDDVDPTANAAAAKSDQLAGPYSLGHGAGDLANAAAGVAGPLEGLAKEGLPAAGRSLAKDVASKARALPGLASKGADVAEHGPFGKVLAKLRDVLKGAPGSSTTTSDAMGGGHDDPGWMPRPDAPTSGPGALPPPTQFEHVSDFGAGDLVDEAPWNPPMDETAVDLTPEMIKRPALENLKAATSDPVPDLSRPAPAPTTELNPNADEGNGVPRPDSDFTDEENRTWPRITPEPAINSSPIGRRPPQPAPDTGSGTPQTGNERPGLQRLRQATADQPPKVGTSPAPSTEATSTAQMPEQQIEDLRNESMLQPPLSMKPAQRFNLDKMRAVLADLPPEQRQAFLDANAAHGQLQLGPLADENGLQMPAGASPRSTAPAHVKAASAEGAHTPKQWLTGAPFQEGNPAMKAAVDANALGNAPQGPHPLADPVGAFKATGGDVIKVREVMTALQGAGMSNVQIAQLMQQAGVQ